MTKVKIFCNCCEGNKTIEEKAYPKGNSLDVPCPKCGGDGWVWSVEVAGK